MALDHFSGQCCCVREVPCAEILNVLWPGPDLTAATMESRASEKREGRYGRAWSASQGQDLVRHKNHRTEK